MIDKKNLNILVLGSKPKPKIPKLHFDIIYTANYSLKKINQNKKIFRNSKIVSICGAKELKKKHIYKTVFNTKIDKLIIRSGKYFKTQKRKYRFKIEQFGKYEQFYFQKNFFQKGLLDMFLGEFCYENFIFLKFKYFKKNLSRGFLGVSTGLFCILYELSKNYGSKIYISGIGLSGEEGHFNDKSNLSYVKRSRVDKFLIQKLKKKHFKRLFSTEKSLCKYSNIKFYNEKYIKLKK
mgnify:CR=1 FL=1|tara:strand:+ start:688 stop:1395 length:708 start_codon:yes stop_codon:yes gene_type:complete